ncbi:hypothetical protein BC938DRAFT_473637 [Jimgerdemannia flammicorona]|uniref:Uncharacterized protein n=1 Tax=Jimgerdemannia flammicorona TaxID=994334 RepID=A0A433Q3S3_9FUNG|nr:hypothetical protein BC938DRAFT_473637 [Jimgerdemannia flammicorona]
MTLESASHYVFERPIRRVAVIGAGPTGLVSARSLLDTGRFEDVVVFERNEGIGGTWVYSPDRDTHTSIPSNHPLTVDPPATLTSSSPPRTPTKSALYASLRTNLPHPVMCFRDDPFHAVALFPGHGEVLQYLKEFAARHGLAGHVRLRSEVVRIVRDGGRWSVTVMEANGRIYKETFDAVMICNGHYYVPYVPEVEGIKRLVEGGTVEVMHSRDYRVPEIFRDKTILVIGNAYSASDIVREALPFAKRVYQSVRGHQIPAPTPTPTATSTIVNPAQGIDNVAHVRPEIRRFLPPREGYMRGSKGSAEFVDGTVLEEEVEVVVFATGYLFSFPFLADFETPGSGPLVTDGVVVHNLYRHLFFIEDPTLCFVGLPRKVSPLPLSQFQSMLVARVWAGLVKLPGVEEMRRWYEKEMLDEQGKTLGRKVITFGLKIEVAYNNCLLQWIRNGDVGEGEGPDGNGDDKVDGGDKDDGEMRYLDNWWVDMRSKALELRKEVLGL